MNKIRTIQAINTMSQQVIYENSTWNEYERTLIEGERFESYKERLEDELTEQHPTVPSELISDFVCTVENYVEPKYLWQELSEYLESIGHEFIVTSNNIIKSTRVTDNRSEYKRKAQAWII